MKELKLYGAIVRFKKTDKYKNLPELNCELQFELPIAHNEFQTLWIKSSVQDLNQVKKLKAFLDEVLTDFEKKE